MAQTLKALIVEDNEDDVQLLVRELRHSGWLLTYEHVDNREDLDRCLQQESWDVIISDYAMPGFSGLEALSIAQAHRPDAPFIVVSGTIGEETAAKVMRLGAHDYIMKHHLALLGPAIERELQEAEMRRKHQHAEAKLAHYQKRLRSLASQLSLAEERERRRIAAGVHDDICQKLALAKLEMQSVQQTLTDTRVIKMLERECGIIDQIIDDAHTLTFELSNPVLYEIGLDAAIEAWLSANVKGKHGLTYEFVSNVKGFKPEEHVLVFVFQSVRELITNTIKHAQASCIRVSLQRQDDTFEVAVEDNGIGFDASKVETTARHGFGLFSVEERLEYLGGKLDIHSEPHQGTRITLTIPWKENAVKTG